MLNVLELTGGVITTATVQAAIDRAAGEGKVLFFPSGVYVTASLTLPDNASILLAQDATLQASPSSEDWREYDGRPLLFADGARNLSIEGGTLHGSGEAHLDALGKVLTEGHHPRHVIDLRNCRDIVIRNLTITQSVTWSCHLDNCEGALVERVTVRNPVWNRSRCSDGVDLNGCRHVVVRYCDIETGDDAICLKNARGCEPREAMYDIHVHDCRLAATCNSTKIGTETFGDIYDVLFENIVIERHSAITADGPGAPTDFMVNPLSAIAIQSNDGASVHDITARNYKVRHALTPVFIVLQPRNRYGGERRGELYNIRVENVEVQTTYRNSAVIAADGMRIKNVQIAGLVATSYEKPSKAYIPAVPTGKEYPDIFRFPAFPAYGLFARNADVTVENCTFFEAEESGRPAVDVG